MESSSTTLETFKNLTAYILSTKFGDNIYNEILAIKYLDIIKKIPFEWLEYNSDNETIDIMSEVTNIIYQINKKIKRGKEKFWIYYKQFLLDIVKELAKRSCFGNEDDDCITKTILRCDTEVLDILLKNHPYIKAFGIYTSVEVNKRFGQSYFDIAFEKKDKSILDILVLYEQNKLFSL